MKQVITLERDKWPGDKLIKVNGETWGKIAMKRRGVHGAVYEFYQAISSELPGLRPVLVQFGNHDDKARMTKFCVWSDKQAHRNAKPYSNQFPEDMQPIKPLQARLQEAAENLVATGNLRPPAHIRAEAQRRADQLRAADRKLRKRAEATASSFAIHVDGLPDSEARRILVDGIVDSMKWAQTQ